MGTVERIEAAIKERVKRLLNATVIDMTPPGMDLDDELGVYTPVKDAEDPADPADAGDEEGDDEEA